MSTGPDPVKLSPSYNPATTAKKGLKSLVIAVAVGALGVLADADLREYVADNPGVASILVALQAGLIAWLNWYKNKDR